MNKIQLFTFALFLGCFSASVWAQPSIEFDELLHNFGKLDQNEGKVTHPFKFKNTGDEDLLIMDVKTTCGCTAPAYTKNYVAPGEEGVVNITYDPFNRPGEFNKTITVKSNAPSRITVLRIKGDVKPRERTAEERYPLRYGNLAFRTYHLSFKDVKDDEVATREFPIYNHSDEFVNITRVRKPPYLEIDEFPVTIAPKEEYKMKVKLDGSRSERFGFLAEQLIFTTDQDKEFRDIEVKVSAEIKSTKDNKDEFVKTKELPRLRLDDDQIDFGRIADNSNPDYKLKITNDGHGELIIHNVSASCGCTATKPDKKRLEPGESTFVSVSFNPKGMNGKQQKSITVMSNDPFEPKKKINLFADIYFKK